MAKQDKEPRIFYKSDSFWISKETYIIHSLKMVKGQQIYKKFVTVQSPLCKNKV